MVNAQWHASLKSEYSGFGNAAFRFQYKEQRGEHGALLRWRQSLVICGPFVQMASMPATGREVFVTKGGDLTFVHNYSDEQVVR